MTMELKDKIDLIGKQVEIIKIKLFVFITMAGGSWVYALKNEGIASFILWFTFATVSVFASINLVKLGMKYNILEKDLINND